MARPAAARLAERILRSQGATFADLAMAPAPAPSPPRGSPPPVDPGAFAVWASRHAAGRLTAWEREFCQSVGRFPRLSPKQRRVLDRIAAKLQAPQC